MRYFIIVNFIAFLLCYIDKRRAILGRWRISERLLLFVSFIGGAFGFLIGMYSFRHKTLKLKFKLVYVFCVMWIIIFYKFW